MKPTLTVYAAGGCAINIVSPLLTKIQENTPGYANIQIGMIDTSHSNLKTDSGKNFFHISSREHETDGSGKVRATNFQAVRQVSPQVLDTFEPGDLNIVLHSTSGGSGSVIGNVLVSELLSQDKNVIVIMVESTTCVKEVENTLDTIQSYQKVAELKNKPVISYYLSNHERSMQENDDMARVMILFLAAVWSGENRGLDRKDLENFLNYQNVTRFPVGVTGLGISDTRIEEGKLGKDTIVSTVVSIIKSGESPDPGLLVAYHAYGELSENVVDSIRVGTPVHLFTLQGHFLDIVDGLNNLKKEGDNRYRVKPVQKIAVDRNSTDDGFII